MKSFLLILSVIFLLATETLTFACPNSDLHDGMEIILNM